MADDFAYLNARVRVRRGTLLKESFFQEALDLSFADFLRLLSETVYGGELAGQGLPDVDRAVLRTQAKLVGDLPRLVTGEAREAVRLLLLRNDLHNLQALLRAKATGRPFEEVLLLPGTLREEVWRQAYEAQDPAGMAQVLAVPGHPLARALRAVLRETQDLARVEALLAKRFFEDVAKAAKGLDQPALRDYLALEVDAENLRTAFKLQGSGLAPDAFFLKGGGSWTGSGSPGSWRGTTPYWTSFPAPLFRAFRGSGPEGFGAGASVRPPQGGEEGGAGPLGGGACPRLREGAGVGGRAP